ncbi:MAG TPA: ArsC family reductase [Methylophilaceae bacterium]|jgi:Spx/MgsR family transcriptional regulator
MKLYGIPNCNTVKKSRTWLESHGISYQFHDFKKDGVNAAMLGQWLEQTTWEKLVNRAGMTWRNLSDTEKAQVHDNDSAIALMLAKPSVIKRPVLVNDARILQLGFDAEKYETLLIESSKK